MSSIDLNCDMGESYGRYELGQDAELMPYLSSCNIACGFHAGDPIVMLRTIKLAIAQELRIGAHPSYPDLQGFGRRFMRLNAEELKAIIQYQVGALKSMVESCGGVLAYVKPHGALYNRAAESKAESELIIEAISAVGPGLALMGMAGSAMEASAKALDQPFIAEAFADRRYTDEGKLMPRTEPKALITKPEEAAQQVHELVIKKQVTTGSGKIIPVLADSVCVHGDHPNALSIIRAIRSRMKADQIEIKA